MGKLTWQQLLYALILLVVSVIIKKLLMTGVRAYLARSSSELGINRFIVGVLSAFLNIIIVTIVAGSLGVSMSSLVALISVLGLAVSLAVQDTLSNLAGGLMLIFSKPFKAGDFVDASGIVGVVTEIGLIYTDMKTIDNRVVHIPNKTLASSVVTNYSALDLRRIDLKISASYDDPIQQVKAALHAAMREIPEIKDDPAPFAGVQEYGSSAIVYVVRAWVDTANYLPAFHLLNEKIAEKFNEFEVHMTYDHINVHLET